MVLNEETGSCYLGEEKEGESVSEFIELRYSTLTEHTYSSYMFF